MTDARAKAEEILKRHFLVWEPVADSTGKQDSDASLARSLLVAFTEALDAYAATQTAALTQLQDLVATALADSEGRILRFWSDEDAKKLLALLPTSELNAGDDQDEPV